jgi:glutaryl-CoA dehydrogenase
MLRPLFRHALRHSKTTAPPVAMGKRYLHAPVKFDWKDPLGASNLYTDEELAIAETAESYCQERMLPRVLGIRHTSLRHDEEDSQDYRCISK